MRVFQILVPVALVAGCATAGCATVPQEEKEESSTASMTSAKEETSVAYGPCAASRATILASVSAARAEAITRGFMWLDADVPFSMTATHDTYRTDCSGFVSMCWSLPAPGLNTRTLGTSGSGSFKLDSYEELVPADALVDVGHHSVIFLGWNDTAHKGACVLEQSSTKNDMQFRVRLTSQLQGDGFVPVRSDEFANDTRVNSPSQTSTPTKPNAADAGGTRTTDDDDTKETTTGTGTGTGTSNETPVCKSTAVALVCAAAYARGIECGRVIDNCGRPVDCTGMPGFGCETGETCNANKCTSTCQPKSVADLCYSAKLKSGIDCGTIPDGCGGTVDCGELTSFRCGGGAACGEDNRCPSKPGTTTGTTSAGTDYEQCEGSHDNPELCPPAVPAAGDPGDEEEAAHTSSTRTASSDDEDDDKPAKKSAGLASAGCSSAPGGSSSGFGGVAIAFFLVLGARRRRAARA